MATKKKFCKGNDCLFCNSECPECGSTQIDVKFKPIFEFENDTDNHICISHYGSELELECQDCGESFSYNDFDQDKTLWPLVRALQNIMSVPSFVNITHDSETGEIDIDERLIVFTKDFNE